MWKVKRGGEVIWRGRGRLLVFPEEVEARAVFQLGAGHTDLGRQNPGPPGVVVGGPDYIDHHSTLHVPVVTWIWFLPIWREVAGEMFEFRLRLDPEKAVHWCNENELSADSHW